jgi:hypothetical protein
MRGGIRAIDDEMCDFDVLHENEYTPQPTCKLSWLLSRVSDEGPSRDMSGWLSTGDLSAVFLLGRMGHRNGDRGCEFAQLVEPTGLGWGK